MKVHVKSNWKQESHHPRTKEVKESFFLICIVVSLGSSISILIIYIIYNWIDLEKLRMEGRPSSFVVSGKVKYDIYGSPPRTSTSSKKPAYTNTSSSDRESKRRKRIAKYKVYTIEGRMKASFRKGIRWIKSKFIHTF